MRPMANFAQNNETKNAVRDLMNPIPDVATFNTICCALFEYHYSQAFTDATSRQAVQRASLLVMGYRPPTFRLSFVSYHLNIPPE